MQDDVYEYRHNRETEILLWILVGVAIGFLFVAIGHYFLVQMNRILSGAAHERHFNEQINPRMDPQFIGTLSNPSTWNCKRRLKKELQKIKRDPPTHCSAGVVVDQEDDDAADDDIIHYWRGAIMGPSDSPFEGGIFFVSICCPLEYPFKPPLIQFETKVFHPNIDNFGNIDLDLLHRCWTPVFNIELLLLTIGSILTDPDTNDSTNPISVLYRNDKETYDEIAREWTKQYAMGS